MSKVISFRLDDTNPREAGALAIINQWSEAGFSVRFVITKALLELSQPDHDTRKNQDRQDLNSVLDQIIQGLELVKTMQSGQPSVQTPDQGSAALPEHFLAAIKQGIKPGVKSD
jgi:hypothetical protein